MVDDGFLSREALDRFVFPNWFRTLEELRRPIDLDPALSEAFEVEELAIGRASANSHDAFADEISRLARCRDCYAGYARGFAASTQRTHLFRPSAKDENEIDELENEFFGRLSGLYRDAPGDYAAETWVSTLVLRRR